MKRIPLIQDPAMRDHSTVPSFEGLTLRECGQQQVDELMVIPVEDMNDAEYNAYRALIDLLLTNRGMKPTANKGDMWWAPICAVFADAEDDANQAPASAMVADPAPLLPPVDPKVARCWCAHCDRLLLDTNPQVDHGIPWDGGHRADALLLLPDGDYMMHACPQCRTDAHLMDLLDSDWWLAPEATQAEAEAWVVQAVERLGAGYHADTPAKGYEDAFDDAKDLACYDLGLAQAHAILGDRIHEIGLREFQRRGWAPPAPVEDHELVLGKAYLKLFHGRDRVNQKMNDWGYDGPTFGPIQYAHMTYGCDLKVALEDSQDADFTLLLTDGLVAHAGKFYGDWSMFVATPEMVKRRNA